MHYDENEIQPGSQGGEANHSGDTLERYVEDQFRRRGIMVRSWEPNCETADLFKDRILTKHVPYRSIYGCRSHSEFVYTRCSTGLKVRIECRWQQESGSVDEKFPYLLENACHRMPESNVWFVIDGGGARPNAVEWLTRNARAYCNKNIRVLMMNDVIRSIRQLVEKDQP